MAKCFKLKSVHIHNPTWGGGGGTTCSVPWVEGSPLNEPVQFCSLVIVKKQIAGQHRTLI